MTPETDMAPTAQDGLPKAGSDDVDFDRLLAAINKRAEHWKWKSEDRGDTLEVAFSTHAPITLDLRIPEAADWFREAHKDGWTIEPLTCLYADVLIDLFGLKTALDIGGHFGFISLFLLRHPNLRHVDVVEMNPHAVRIIKAHLPHNRATMQPDTRLRVHWVGLSDFDALQQSVWYEGMRLSFEKHNRFTEAKLDILKLKSLCDRIGYVPDLIKIDIEGFEGRLVADLEAILDRVRPKVLMELHWDEIVERNGATRLEVVMPFLKRGYRCGRLNWHQRMPKRNFMQEVTLANVEEVLSSKNHAMYVFF